MEFESLRLYDERISRISDVQMLQGGYYRRRLVSADVVSFSDLVAITTLDRLAHLVPKVRQIGHCRHVSVVLASVSRDNV